ncbi:sterol desaturase [Leptospira ryugenii]|uniref:Sterol desaturase n=1 Tax=Leptospira ryugenii TaxID=1917863 RepID=A0A2P2E157_9LEPT|nr:sterol desaturase family protein [Leptospira ryugenii]GBF50602.1 sterol desaturase [Leptospira ryugenii]
MFGPVQCELGMDCLLKVGTFQFSLNVIRYYPIAGFAFLFFYLWKKDSFARFRIQKVYPQMDKVWKEFRQSAVTLFVFSLVAVGNILAAKAKLIPSQVYFGKVDGLFGYAYILLSFLLLTAWHETWFYWMHRFAHLKRVYPYVHLEHHMSVNPTPLAAYRFQATEAFLEAIYLVLFIRVVPIHFYVILFHTFYAMIMNIWWHLGYEFFPRGFASHPIFKWINTSTHHNQHHQKFQGNYSLYFNVWDRIMGTNFPNYEAYYDQVTEERDKAKQKEIKSILTEVH